MGKLTVGERLAKRVQAAWRLGGMIARGRHRDPKTRSLAGRVRLYGAPPSVRSAYANGLAGRPCYGHKG